MSIFQDGAHVIALLLSVSFFCDFAHLGRSKSTCRPDFGDIHVSESTAEIASTFYVLGLIYLHIVLQYMCCWQTDKPHTDIEVTDWYNARRSTAVGIQLRPSSTVCDQ